MIKPRSPFNIASIFCLLLTFGCQPRDLLSAKNLNSGPVLYGSTSIELDDNQVFFEKLFPGETYVINWNELDKFQKGGTTSHRVPYHDSWYPYNSGGTNVRGALSLYDAAFNTNASAWEAKNHTNTEEDKKRAAEETPPRSLSWHGHCNGTSVASIRYESPRKSVFRPAACLEGQPSCRKFTPEIIRALLAEISMSVEFKFVGGNLCNEKEEDAQNEPRLPDGQLGACGDINPASFHAVLVNYLGRMKQPLIHDHRYYNEKWNYPIYTYSYQATSLSEAEAASAVLAGSTKWTFNSEARSWKMVHMSYGYAESSDAVDPDIAGKIIGSPKAPGQLGEVDYIIELDQEGRMIGGEWIAQSKTDHPDFIWIPFEPRESFGDFTSNPEINPDTVVKIWAESVDRDPNVPFPPQTETSRVLFYPLDVELTEWGENDFYQISVDGGATGAVLLKFKEKDQYAAEGAKISIESKLCPKGLCIEGAVVSLGLNGKDMGKLTIIKGKASIQIVPQSGMNILTLRWTPGKESNMEDGSISRLDSNFTFYGTP